MNLKEVCLHMFKMYSLTDYLTSVSALVTFVPAIKMLSIFVLVIFIVLLSSRHLSALDLIQLSLKHLWRFFNVGSRGTIIIISVTSTIDITDDREQLYTKNIEY